MLPKKVEICISQLVFEEYFEVLNRPKFSKYLNFETNANIVLHKILQNATLYKPNFSINVIADAADNRLLELAATCSADFLITVNTNDFTFPEFEYTQIVTPNQYWNIYAQNLL